MGGNQRPGCNDPSLRQPQRAQAVYSSYNEGPRLYYGRRKSCLRYTVHPTPFSIRLISRDYTKGQFVIRAMTNPELQKLKTDVTNCFKAAALSTMCKLRLVDKMEYKGDTPT